MITQVGVVDAHETLQKAIDFLDGRLHDAVRLRKVE